MSPKDWRTDALACAYDHAMASQKDLRRAHRGAGRDLMTSSMIDRLRESLEWDRKRTEAKRREEIGIARLRISMGLRDGSHPYDALVDDQGVPVDGLPVLHGLTDAGRVR